MTADRALALRLVPDSLWDVAAPLIPGTRRRRQGGGRQRVDDRAVLAAVLFVVTSGVAWRGLPAYFEVAPATAYRRFVEWNRIGLWRRLHEAAGGRLDPELVRWLAAVEEAAASRAASDRARG